jgi:hypothetical protein
MSQLDPMYTPQANAPKIHSDPILPSTPWSSKWSLSLCFSQQSPAHIPLPSHACHMPRPGHSPWLVLPNDTWDEYKLWSSSLCNFHQSSITSESCSQTT